MRLLLDTHIFIWLIDGNPKLSQTARQAIEDESNTLYLSIVSLWEITIKTSLGKLELAIPLEQIVINFIPSPQRRNWVCFLNISSSLRYS